MAPRKSADKAPAPRVEITDELINRLAAEAERGYDLKRLRRSKPTSGRRKWGNVQPLPSGHYRASYIGPDKKRYYAPTVFLTMTDGEEWLSVMHADIIQSRWKAPTPPSGTLAPYAERWFAERRNSVGQPLKASTRQTYRELLDSFILPAPFAALEIAEIDVRLHLQKWFDRMLDKTSPSRRYQAFALLRAILNTAVKDRIITYNPCKDVNGAKQPVSEIDIEVIDTDKLAELVAAISELHPRYRMLVYLGAWSSLRSGELRELRRNDIDIDLRRGIGYIRVHRSVYQIKGEYVVGEPKSTAGRRRVALPPHVLQPLADYIEEFAAPGRKGLIFPSSRDPSKHLSDGTFQHHWYPAREAVGLPNFRFHDLRHVGNTWYAMSGATLKDMMHRMGHNTPRMALRYLHAVEGRDQMLAARMSEMLADNVVDLASWKERRAA